SNTARTGRSTTKKTSTSKASRSTPANASTPLDTRDTRFIQWVGDKWNGLENHHQQRIFSTVLLILSLLLFGALTAFQTAPVLRDISNFFQAIFGWSAYPLALGLVAFAVAHLVEGAYQRQFIR